MAARTAAISTRVTGRQWRAAAVTGVSPVLFKGVFPPLEGCPRGYSTGEGAASYGASSPGGRVSR